MFKSKIKWVALGGLVLSLLSLFVHMFLANTSVELVQYHVITGFVEDLNVNVVGQQRVASRKLWKKVKPLEDLQPYANPRNKYPVPVRQNNGFIHAKIFGGFEKIRSSICDLVTISRLLNATLVIPEIQESSNSKGISSEFKSFSYLYNVDHFINSLRGDVIIVKDLPPKLKEIRKRKRCPMFKPQKAASPEYYIKEVLPKLRKGRVIGLVVVDGGCLKPILPRKLAEYQRLRCRVAFQALHFRSEVLALAHQMVKKLRSSGKPYLAYHPGLVRDTLAYQGCAELFQVGLLLRAMGYPPTTRIYLAGSERFGGQRVMISLRAMYTNLVDGSNLCSKYQLNKLLGTETLLPLNPVNYTTFITSGDKEWAQAGPRPRPLPPPPGRPIYRHEKEGWYGWISEKDSEPDPSPIDLRDKAHRLLWDALDYVVSVEADAFFPGFNNDGTRWPDFSSLVMGHRLYVMASSLTYRPDRKFLANLFNSSRENLYFPSRNWTLEARKHLNNSLGKEGLKRQLLLSKPNSFLSHPLPECSCTISKLVGNNECPKWLKDSFFKSRTQDSTTANENEQPDDETEEEEMGSDDEDGTSRYFYFDQDQEMDPND